MAIAEGQATIKAAYPAAEFSGMVAQSLRVTLHIFPAMMHAGAEALIISEG
jgi:hypothetical protein